MIEFISIVFGSLILLTAYFVYVKNEDNQRSLLLKSRLKESRSQSPAIIQFYVNVELKVSQPFSAIIYAGRFITAKPNAEYTVKDWYKNGFFFDKDGNGYPINRIE